MGVGCQSRRFNCLFWRETRQRILGHEISPYPEVVRGGEWELTTRPRREELRLDRREANSRSWRGITEGQSTSDTEQRGEETRLGPVKKSLKMSDSSSIVEFSLVTRTSVSLYLLSGMHMHVVLHTFLCSW